LSLRSNNYQISEIMKKYVLIFGLSIVILSTLAFEILSSGGKSGYTNSPGENNCTSCHSGTLNSGPGSVEIKSDPSMENGYTPGSVYSMTVTVTHNDSPNNGKFGFALEALFDDGSNGGKLAVSDADKTQIQVASINGNNRDNIIHTGSGNTGPNSQDFTFDWTAPDTGDQTVTFYAVGNAANNNGSSFGDYIYATTLEVKSTTTNITADEFSNEVKVFPNPSNGIFTLETGNFKHTSFDLNIVNTNGTIIHQAIVDKSSSQIDLRIYPKGNYILRLSDQNEIITKKISIQ